MDFRLIGTVSMFSLSCWDILGESDPELRWHSFEALLARPKIHKMHILSVTVERNTYIQIRSFFFHTSPPIKDVVSKSKCAASSLLCIYKTPERGGVSR